jgi:MOSC domain-containing protein YiiM
MNGNVTQIFVADDAAEPMESLSTIEAVAGQGLRGDRYFNGSGTYGPHIACEVTLIESEAIGDIQSQFDIDLTDGRHRRNIVMEGVPSYELLARRFRIGAAVLEGRKPRPPCAHVERVADEEGVEAALAEKRGGICASVIESGPISVGDPVELIGEDGSRDERLKTRVETVQRLLERAQNTGSPRAIDDYIDAAREMTERIEAEL